MFPRDPESRRVWLAGTLLRAGEVAVLLQVSRRTVAAWAAAGRLPFIETPGGHRRFRASEVARIIDGLYVNPGA